MKTTVKITNNIGKFGRKVDSNVNVLLSALGVDILRLSKQQVPLKKSQLQSSGILQKVADKKYKIVYNKEYASYQHRGGRKDGSRTVRNYTYPGKKSHYLLDPAQTILEQIKSYYKRYL